MFPDARGMPDFKQANHESLHEIEGFTCALPLGYRPKLGIPVLLLFSSFSTHASFSYSLTSFAISFLICIFQWLYYSYCCTMDPLIRLIQIIMSFSVLPLSSDITLSFCLFQPTLQSHIISYRISSDLIK